MADLGPHMGGTAQGSPEGARDAAPLASTSRGQHNPEPTAGTRSWQATHCQWTDATTSTARGGKGPTRSDVGASASAGTGWLQVKTLAPQHARPELPCRGASPRRRAIWRSGGRARRDGGSRRGPATATLPASRTDFLQPTHAAARQ